MNINTYLSRTYRRQELDLLLQEHVDLYHGVVLDVGGRDRGHFKKPKEHVDRWIFADIDDGYHPDMVLDITDMEQVENKSIDIINAIELFEHVSDIDKGLKECFRVLKPGGMLILSMPFLYPIHADPEDYRRLTGEGWKSLLSKTGFHVSELIRMGGYFSVCLDMHRNLVNRLLGPFRFINLLVLPFLDIIARLDRIKYIRRRLGIYTNGYFVTATKLGDQKDTKKKSA